MPDDLRTLLTRRHFLGRSAGLGAVALAWLLEQGGRATPGQPVRGGLPELPHHTPTAKRVIFLFQSGAPSQLDLFDYKPLLAGLRGTDLPASIRMGQRLTGMTATQQSFPVAPSM